MVKKILTSTWNRQEFWILKVESKVVRFRKINGIIITFWHAFLLENRSERSAIIQIHSNSLIIWPKTALWLNVAIKMRRIVRKRNQTLNSYLFFLPWFSSFWVTFHPYLSFLSQDLSHGNSEGIFIILFPNDTKPGFILCRAVPNALSHLLSVGQC